VPRRLCVILLLLGLLAVPAGAAAQALNSPQFSPPSQQPAPSQPVQTVPPRTSSSSTGNGNISAQTTILLFAVMIIGLGAIVLYIRRDARAAAPVTERDRSPEDIHGRAKSAARHKAERKRQARARAKRQRQARKKQR
jgi:cytoskeletal protein RodZ